MSIPPYEPPKSAPSPGAGNTLLCPKCAGVMKTYERNGIHLEQCDTCRGIFLDFGELESLTQMENRFVQAAPPPAASACSTGTTTAPAGAIAATSTTASRGSAGCSSPASPSGRTRPSTRLASRRSRRVRLPSPPPGRRRPARTARAPATGRRGQRGSVGVLVRLQKHRPVVVGDQPGRPERQPAGRGPKRGHRPRDRRRRSAATARSATAGRAGRDASRRAPTSTADPVSRPARPRRAVRRLPAGRSSLGRLRSASTARRSRCGQPCAGVRGRHRLGVQPGEQSAGLGPRDVFRLGTTVSTRGQRVRHVVPTRWGTTSSGDRKEPDSAAMRSRVVSALGSVPGRCSL